MVHMVHNMVMHNMVMRVRLRRSGHHPRDRGRGPWGGGLRGGTSLGAPVTVFCAKA